MYYGQMYSGWHICDPQWEMARFLYIGAVYHRLYYLLPIRLRHHHREALYAIIVVGAAADVDDTGRIREHHVASCG